MNEVSGLQFIASLVGVAIVFGFGFELGRRLYYIVIDTFDEVFSRLAIGAISLFGRGIDSEEKDEFLKKLREERRKSYGW